MANQTLPATCSQCGGTLTPDGLCARCLMAAAALPTEPSLAKGAAPTLEQVAAAFPHLEVLAMIGQGGMGSVFKVRQPKLDRFAALKLLPESLAIDPAFAGRFEREARLLAKLSHPNIVAVYDYGLAANFFYLLMEFIDGVNLRQAMQASRFEPRQALGIVPKICDALQYAHDEGVLHRDIKPENILLDTKGRVKLVDFGIAKLTTEIESTPASISGADSAFTRAGVTLGTPSYMAPEQQKNPSEVDHRADIYSLGVVFYELLTGELPNGLAQPSSKSDADPRVDAIVQQALEKERDRRQHSASEMRTQLQTIATSSYLTSRIGVAVLQWRDRWIWDTSYVTAMFIPPAIFFSAAIALLAFWSVGFTALVTVPGFAVTVLFPAIYGWVGYRVQKLKSALPRSQAQVADALIFRRPLMSPGIAVLHADRLELIAIAGKTISIPLADIAAVSEVRWFNGKRLLFKHGFVMDLTDGQRIGVAVAEVYGRRWRAVLSRGSLPEIPASEPSNLSKTSAVNLPAFAMAGVAVLGIAETIVLMLRPWPTPRFNFLPSDLIYFGARLFAMLLVGYGALEMRRLKNYAWPIMGAVIVLLWAFRLRGWLMFAIPIPVWSLAVLLRKDVRDAFEDTAPPPRLRQLPNENSTLAFIASSFWGLSGIVSVVAWIRMPNPPQVIVWAILVAAITAVLLAIPVRATKLGKKTLIGSGINIAIWVVIAALSRYIVPPTVAGPNSIDLHCIVFEADAGLVDKLIPTNQRQNGKTSGSESAFETNEGKSREDAGTFTVRKTIPLTDSQLAEVDSITLTDLQKGIDPAIGLLLDRTRSVSTDWWHPGVAETWSFSRAFPKQLIGGSANSFLGFRHAKGTDQVRIDSRVTHDITAIGVGRSGQTDVASILLYEGNIPPHGQLIFLVPFFRADDNSAHYLVVAYGIGNSPEMKPTTMPAPPANAYGAITIQKEVRKTQNQLVDLQRIYGDNHPIIIRERIRLASLEKLAVATTQP